jgi:hypothetical protein
MSQNCQRYNELLNRFNFVQFVLLNVPENVELRPQFVTESYDGTAQQTYRKLDRIHKEMATAQELLKMQQEMKEMKGLLETILEVVTNKGNTWKVNFLK